MLSFILLLLLLVVEEFPGKENGFTANGIADIVSREGDGEGDLYILMMGKKGEEDESAEMFFYAGFELGGNEAEGEPEVGRGAVCEGEDVLPDFVGEVRHGLLSFLLFARVVVLRSMTVLCAVSGLSKDRIVDVWRR